MSEIQPVVPVSKVFDCGDGYGRATVRDASGGAPRLVEVDLNPDDHSPEPRILTPGGESVEVTPEFVSAYRGLSAQRGLQPWDLEVCQGLRENGTRSPLWLAVPLTTAALTTYLDYKFRNNLRTEDNLGGNRGLADDTLSTVMNVSTIGGKALTTVSYTWIEPQLARTPAFVADGLYLGAGAFAAGTVLIDDGGDPALDFALRSVNDVASARAYRHWGIRWGAAAQGGLGAFALTAGLLIPRGRPTISGTGEDDIYVDEGEERSPFRPDRRRFPNLGNNLIEIGAIDLGWAATRAAYSLFGGDPNKVDRPVVSLRLGPDEAMVGVDLLALGRLVSGGPR